MFLDIQKQKIELEREFGKDEKKKGNGEKYVRFCNDRITAAEGRVLNSRIPKIQKN